MSTTITVLKDGYADQDENGWSRANCTCTLVQTPDNVVIVDTMTPWDGQFLTEQLEILGVHTGDVNYVISTHGHSDHTGNNSMFLNAKQHIVGFCISKGDKYYMHPFEHDEPFVIDDYVSVIPTPGHTNEDISVLVKTKVDGVEKIVVIAGDLFEREEDIMNPDIWTGNSFQPDTQVKNRLKVLKLASKIIPGHGPMFDVKEEHIAFSEKLVQKYQLSKQ